MKARCMQVLVAVSTSVRTQDETNQTVSEHVSLASESGGSASGGDNVVDAMDLIAFRLCMHRRSY